MRVRRPLIAAAAALLMLAGCGGDDAATGGAVAAPDGGWPQAEGGRVTPAMCGLITPEDFKSIGHDQIMPMEARTTPPPAGNAVECEAAGGDFFGLIVQPTIEAATIWHKASLAGRKKEVVDHKRETILAENVMTGADESWYDYWLDSGPDEKFQDYQLRVRRGALIVQLHLGGITSEDEIDPKAALAALAGRVFERVGDLGRADTGSTPTMHLEVTGKGKAQSISYYVPDNEEVVDVKNVKLPWRKDVKIADHGQTALTVTLSATLPISAATPVPPPVGCRVLLDGKVVAESRGDLGLAQCTGYLPPKG